MKKVNIVSEEELYELIDIWNFKTGILPKEKYLAFCDNYIVADNTTDEFFVEEFEDLLEAVKWLYEIEEEKEENQPPNLIQKGALFASIADVFYRTLSTDVTSEEASEILFVALDFALKNAGCDIEKIWKGKKDGPL